MSKQVSINIGEYRDKVGQIKNSQSGLTTFGCYASFNRTNIKPFTDDLEMFIEATKLFARYKEILEADIQTLVKVGESIQKQDEALARASNKVSGPQAAI
ncbi:TIGR04197 family type VII secretion effector [Numidum massiliense]|uniref:TIGR04197 family type VII secretion effector n=1 Tax=Numidum massiliense TaxID=1522315 RepID=UPI0006D52E99|nr:TIGR04197 family type VII secretion effector [Numidum massiliense]